MTDQNIKFFIENTRNRNIVWRPYRPEEFSEYNFDFVTAQHFVPSRSFTGTFKGRTFFLVWYNANIVERSQLAVEFSLNELIGDNLKRLSSDQTELQKLSDEINDGLN